MTLDSQRRVSVLGCALAIGCAPAVEDVDGETTDPTGASATPSTSLDEGEDDGDDGSSGIADDDGTITASSNASDTAGEETGDPECGPAAACTAPAPDGWFGPTIHARTSGPEFPACPDGYADPGPTVLEGWGDPGPAICDCECPLSQAQTCTAYMYSHSTMQCQEYLQYANVTENCSTVPVSGFTTFQAYPQNQPFCEQMKTEEFPPAVWDATIHSCKLSAPGPSCGGGERQCTPLPPEGFSAEVCVYQQGDLACPAGDYSTKYMFYTDVEDTRDCSNCTCGQPVANCSANMVVFDGPDCAGDPVASVPSTGVCTTATGGSIAMELAGNEGCAVTTMPEPMGAIAPVGEFTFCCAG